MRKGKKMGQQLLHLVSETCAQKSARRRSTRKAICREKYLYSGTLGEMGKREREREREREALKRLNLEVAKNI